MPRLTILAISALLVVAFLTGWHLRGQRAGRELADLTAHHARALADALEDARTIEQKRIRDMETLHHETQQQLDAAADAARRAADERVRDIAAQYAARHRPSPDDSAAAGQCEAAANAARVLAQLLGELDALAERYAAEADRRRIIGLACEAGYDNSRSSQPSRK